jgi:protein ImuB
VLLVRMVRGQRVVVDACPEAWRAGVRPGLSLAQARAMMGSSSEKAGKAPKAGAKRVRATKAHGAAERGVDAGASDAGVLHVEEEDASRDHAALLAMARWIQKRWSPRVEVDGADGLLLDITGCAHLFGGERELVRSLAKRLFDVGLTSRGAIASTRGAAWGVARYAAKAWTIVEDGEELAALEALNVAALRADAAAVEALAQVGVDRVGQLVTLPRRALPSRYGADLLVRLDQALGTLSEQVDRTVEIEPIVVAREIPGGTTRLEDLHLLVRELLEEVEDRLAVLEAGVREVELAFARLGERKDEDDEERVVVRVSRPTRDAGHVCHLARNAIDRIHMGFGIERVEARAGDATRLVHRQSSMGGAQENAWQDDAAFAALGDTLAQRLGRERVMHGACVQRHRPEHAAKLVAMDAKGQSAREEERSATDAAWAMKTLGPRPTRLFTPAIEAQTIALTPDGPVMRLRWQGQDRAIVASVGPERVGPEWWQPREPTRDYFRVQDDRGRWLWVYRELDGAEPDARWFVHGEWS